MRQDKQNGRNWWTFRKKDRLPDYMTENVQEDLIRLEDMVKIYDTGVLKVLGLKRINLTIHRGEFVESWDSPGLESPLL